MKEMVQSALDNYVLAYKNNDKELFQSLWDDHAVFEDPVGADPCNGIEAICAFWDFGHSNGMEIVPTNVETVICANEGILKAVMQVRNIADTNLNFSGETAEIWMKYAQCFAGKSENPPHKGSRFIQIS